MSAALFGFTSVQELSECVLGETVTFEGESLEIIRCRTSESLVNIEPCKVLAHHEAVSLEAYEEARVRIDDIA